MNPWSLSLWEKANERFEGPEEEKVLALGLVEELSILLLEIVELSFLLYCDVVPHSAILPKIFMLSIAASRCLPPTLSDIYRIRPVPEILKNFTQCP
jgi:hypothetical protein